MPIGDWRFRGSSYCETIISNGIEGTSKGEAFTYEVELNSPSVIECFAPTYNMDFFALRLNRPDNNRAPPESCNQILESQTGHSFERQFYGRKLGWQDLRAGSRVHT